MYVNVHVEDVGQHSVFLCYSQPCVLKQGLSEPRVSSLIG